MRWARSMIQAALDTERNPQRKAARLLLSEQRQVAMKFLAQEVNP